MPFTRRRTRRLAPQTFRDFAVGWAFLHGVDSNPNTDYAGWVSHNVFSMYQLMFAIITPALIIGAIAERMKYAAVLLFVAWNG